MTTGSETMFDEFSLTSWLALGIIVLFGYIAITRTKDIVLRLLGFLIPVLIAASLLGFFDLAQGVTVTVLVLALSIIALIVVLGYKLLKHIGEWVNQQIVG